MAKGGEFVAPRECSGLSVDGESKGKKSLFTEVSSWAIISHGWRDNQEAPGNNNAGDVDKNLFLPFIALPGHPETTSC